jgi:hypothetical protein
MIHTKVKGVMIDSTWSLDQIYKQKISPNQNPKIQKTTLKSWW